MRENSRKTTAVKIVAAIGGLLLGAYILTGPVSLAAGWFKTATSNGEQTSATITASSATNRLDCVLTVEYTHNNKQQTSNITLREMGGKYSRGPQRCPEYQNTTIDILVKGDTITPAGPSLASAQYRAQPWSYLKTLLGLTLATGAWAGWNKLHKTRNAKPKT